jgi:hypothetical protein
LGIEKRLEAPPGFEPGVEVLQLDLTPRITNEFADLLSTFSHHVLLTSAEECPKVPRWLWHGYSHRATRWRRFWRV